MSVLKRRRAPAHRSFIGPEFGAGEDGIDPKPLTYPEILADDRLAALGKEIYAKLREQFAEPGGVAQREENSEEEQYRLKLEGWADILEILLEETLIELDNLNAAQAGPAISTDPEGAPLL